MKWLRKMRIAPRLLAAFAIIAAAAAAIGIWGWRSLQQIHEDTAVAARKYTDVQGYLSGMSAAIQEQRALLSQMIVFEDANDADRIRQRITDSDTGGLQQLADYKRACETQAELQKYTAIAAALEEFRTLRKETVMYAQAGAFEASRETWLHAEGATAYALELLHTAAVNGAEKAARLYAQQETRVRNTLWLLLGLAGVWLGLAGLLLYALAFSITEPLRVLAAATARVAAGRLDAKACADAGGADEVGRLAAGLQDMMAATRAMAADMALLSMRVAKGDFECRTDEAAYKGEYRRMARDINGLLEAAAMPMSAAAQALEELTRGNLWVSLEGAYTGGPARLQRALRDAAGMLRAHLMELRCCLAAMEQGDFTQEIRVAFAGDFEELRHTVNGAARQCGDVMRRVEEELSRMANTARYITSSAQTVSGQAAGQAGGLQGLVTGVAEMVEQAWQNAESVAQAGAQAAKIMGEAEKGANTMARAQAAMRQAHEAAAGASQIAKGIEEIARQANLLCVHVAVETAHVDAGGADFAVVEEEARSLAAQSARVAKEAAALLCGSAKKSAAGLAQAEDAAAALQRLQGDVVRAARAGSKIVEDSREQAAALAHTNQEIAQVGSAARSSAAIAARTAAAIEQLRGQAEILEQLTGSFCWGAPPQAGPAARGQGGREGGRVRDRKTSNGSTLHLLTREEMHPAGDAGGEEKVIVLRDDEFEEY